MQRNLIIAIAVLAAAAIVYFFVVWTGLPIPTIVWQILGTVIVAVLAIVAIKAIFRSANGGPP